jgi:uncharacterized protein YbjT (DUF2867 family)
MRIVVVGATGRTGTAVVEQALARGWEVVALVRDPSKVSASSPNLRVVRGSPLDEAAVAGCVEGADAVISVVGAPAGLGSRGATTLYSGAAAAVAAALRADARTRILFCTSAGVEHDDPSQVWFYRHVARPLFLARGYADMARAEQIVRDSGRPFVIIRPGRLVDRPPRGSLRESPRFRPARGVDTPRCSLATYLLDQVTQDRWLGQTPTVTE